MTCPARWRSLVTAQLHSRLPLLTASVGGRMLSRLIFSCRTRWEDMYVVAMSHLGEAARLIPDGRSAERATAPELLPEPIAIRREVRRNIADWKWLGWG